MPRDWGAGLAAFSVGWLALLLALSGYLVVFGVVFALVGVLWAVRAKRTVSLVALVPNGLALLYASILGVLLVVDVFRT
jgi:hypothetical protein